MSLWAQRCLLTRTRKVHITRRRGQARPHQNKQNIRAANSEKRKQHIILSLPTPRSRRPLSAPSSHQDIKHRTRRGGLEGVDVALGRRQQERRARGRRDAVLLLPPCPAVFFPRPVSSSSSPGLALTGSRRSAISRAVGVSLFCRARVRIYVVRVDAQAAEQYSRQHGHFLGSGGAEGGGRRRERTMTLVNFRTCSCRLNLHVSRSRVSMRLRIGAGLGRARSGNVQTTNQKFV